MAYLFLFLGFLLIVFFMPEALRQLSSQEKEVSLNQLEARIANLEDTLEEALTRMERKAIFQPELKSPAPTVPERSFAEHLAQAQVDPYAEIRRAYAAGEDIAALASRYGKGKGEIELILNLRRFPALNDGMHR
ncbi:MAG: hypothetical protein PWP65_332 [Clostridia bacterium]|nr:hypothetical protein [Clostridia bacterium]